MSFLNRLFNLFRRENTPVGAAPAPREGGVAPWLLSTSPAMCVATAHRCVQLLSDSVATLPMRYMRLRGDVYVEDYSSPLHYLLSVAPSPGTNAFNFWRGAVRQMLLAGNAYIVPVRDPVDFEVQRLVLCTRGSVTHDTMRNIYTVSDAYNGIFGTYTAGEIVHLRGAEGRDPRRGVSVIEHARLTLHIAATGDQQTHSRFENGGDIRGIVSSSTGPAVFGTHSTEEVNNAAADIDQRLRMGERFVGLVGDNKLTPLTMSSTDMQFLESRKFTVREICRFFGVHPSFVFDDTSNNYKSAEQANVAFLSHTLNPLLVAIETELQAKLVSESACHTRLFQFNRRSLHACDLESRYRNQAQRLANGTATVNELRAEENMPRVPDGDTIFTSANIKPLNSHLTPK